MAGPDAELTAKLQPDVPHAARIWNYWMGGKDNFAVDRASGDEILKAFPTARIAALENRRFLQRATRYLAAEAGIRQFLDIGTGLPTADNTHEVAQGIAPESRVVYVDNDPMVMVHARALLTSTPEGRTTYIEADLRSPEQILADPDLRATLDLGEPVALMLVAVLHFIRDDEDPQGIVDRLVGALPPGSYVVATHATWEFQSAAAIEKLTAANPDGRFVPRTGERLAELLRGLDFVDPGLVSVSRWRADDAPQPRPAIEDVSCNGVVARLPA